MSAHQQRQVSSRRSSTDRSWLVKGQRAYFVHQGERKAGNVKEVYPEPPYSEYVKVRLDDGEEAYVPFASIAEGFAESSAEGSAGGRSSVRE
ncbi:MAG: hypothetical protein M3P70_07830 [Actinomycetota bacterium]|nr:hypothetical protein [Actinomycetota bacterium]